MKTPSVHILVDLVCSLLVFLLVRFIEYRRRAHARRSSVASNPGGIKLSRAKLSLLCPGEYPSFFTFNIAYLRSFNIADIFRGKDVTREFSILRIEDHLLRGDSRAAVVVSVSPLGQGVGVRARTPHCQRRIVQGWPTDVVPGADGSIRSQRCIFAWGF